MAALSKKETERVYGVEQPEDSNRRVRQYIHRYFKNNPRSFFLEWNRHKMLIDDGKQWSVPTFVRKVSVFMQQTTIRGQTDSKLFIEVTHSALMRLKTLRAKKYSAHRTTNKYALLMIITNVDPTVTLDDDGIREIFKTFNRDKKNGSFDQRLSNLAYYIVENSLSDDKQYKLHVCRDSFFNDDVRRFLPFTHHYLSYLSK